MTDDHSSVEIMRFPRAIPLLPIAIASMGLLLAGCQGAVTADLAVDAPADPQISSVKVDVTGLEFQRSDGTTQKVEFTAPEPTDLVRVLESNPLRMFTNEALSQGTYSGVRLLLTDNGSKANVFRTDGTQFPLQLADGDYTPIEFTVEKNKSSSASYALSLDLRKSLSYSSDNQQYTLKPAMRSASSAEAAEIDGTVNVTCPLGTSLATGGAVYLFTGSDVEPNDIGSAVQPYATAAITTASVIGQFTYSYTLRFLPAGDYTIAVTCNGNDDSPDTDDDVNFIGTANVTVAATQVLTQDLTN
jgi:hypothetical protein